MKNIREITETMVSAMNRDDIQAVFNFLSDDAVLFPPTEPPKTGAVLFTWFSEFLNNFSVHFNRYTDEEIVEAGDLAFNHYSYEWTVTPKAGGESMVGCGHGLRILKLQPDDTWKITNEMWSGYKPQMAAEEIKR
jgi:ketosteroid isomerase-like protein